MIEDSSWSDKHGRLFVKENGRWRPAMLGEYPGLAEGQFKDRVLFNEACDKLKNETVSAADPYMQGLLHSVGQVPDEHWRVIAVIAILVAMVLAFVLVLS